MKKHFTLIFTLFLLLLQIPASAQGEWKWANYWTGNDDPMSGNNPFNYIVRTAFDDDGNIYVFGSFGGNASIYDQSQDIYIASDVTIALANTPGAVLAKYDTMGNLLWKKSIKGSHDNSCLPYDMAIQNDRITIAGEYSWDYGSNNKLWFIDTLISQQVALSYPSNEFHPPFTFGHYTYFVSFDLNGNMLESHFIKTLTRELYDGQHFEYPLGQRLVGAYPVCMDGQNNTYIAISTQYGGVDSLPFTIIIDEDSLKTYQIFLPGNCVDPSYVVNNILIYKFTPTWELDWAKVVINNTDGLASLIPNDTINPPYFFPYIGGLNIDENDNLYLSGTIEGMDMADAFNQYPMSIFWDDSHFATVNDHGLAMSLPFVIKYNSSGNVQWANQAFVRNPANTALNLRISWTDNCVTDDAVYLVGNADLLEGLSAQYFFDNENNTMPITQSSAYFVRFNKINGEYESSGIVPGEKSAFRIGKTARPAVINNHLLMMPANYTNTLWQLCYFNTNGIFEKADTISHSHNKFSSRHDVKIDEQGHILCGMTTSEDLTFGNDLTLNFDDHQHSHAVIAYRYDPSILEPYPEDSTGIAEYNDLGNPVHLYPNPTASTLHVENEDSFIEHIVILDMSGKELLRQNVLTHRYEINVSSLPNGMYIVKITTQEGTHINKFVKTN